MKGNLERGFIYVQITVSLKQCRTLLGTNGLWSPDGQEAWCSAACAGLQTNWQTIKFKRSMSLLGELSIAKFPGSKHTCAV